MLLQPLAQRHRQPEWMDQPGIDPAAHSQALEGLRRINAISGAVGSLFAPIRSLALEQGIAHPLRVLDLACGGGDNTIALAERARKEGLAVRIDGCDLSGQAVAIAARHAAERNLDGAFFQADALKDPLPADYDVILCSLFLHHLDDDEAVDLLRRMGHASRSLVLVNDLIRSPLGYGLAWLGCRLLSRSPIVHFDGPVSVQGAFRLEEALALAARAGLAGARVQRSWPERYLLRWRRPDGPPPAS
jgi:2-polyprenyl-3-methyl-5-hydroxy-6-metoxy-1,4-benzoquinol methylase